MNHHSFLIKQALSEMPPPETLTGRELSVIPLSMGLAGAATAGLSRYQDPELEKRRNRLKDVLWGGLYGLGVGAAGAVAGAAGGSLLGAGAGNIYARLKKLPVAGPLPHVDRLTPGDMLSHWIPGTRQRATLEGATGGLLGGGAVGGLAGSYKGGRMAARRGEEKAKAEKEKEEGAKKEQEK